MDSSTAQKQKVERVDPPDMCLVRELPVQVVLPAPAAPADFSTNNWGPVPRTTKESEMSRSTR
jgi:hypothetical protein